MHQVTRTIIEGQRWDLEYFSTDTLTAVQDAEQLDHYTYQVAGCVGEFWTEVLTLHGYISAGLHEFMLEKGVNYGKGLQLTNIIRDVPEDFANGRCYLPNAGETVAEVISATDPYLLQARQFLADGRAYAQELTNRRLRAASLLPAMLGEKTLDLLSEASAEQRLEKVKVSKQTVFVELAKSFL